MSRISIATLISALILSPLVASSQTPDLVAELALPASSSSSSNAALESPSTDAVTSAAAPALKPEGGSRLPFSGVGVGVRVGLAGVGFDLATPLIPQRLNLRGGASFFSYSPSTITTSDNLNIDGSLKFQNAAAMVNFFPFRGRLRLSGGVTVYNFTNLSATVNVPAGNSFTLGDTTYYSDPSKPLTGNGAFNFGGKTAGRVSIGTGNMLPRKGRFTFESELGVQFFSEPTVSYTFSGNGCMTKVGNVYSNCGPVSSTDVASEQQKIQDDIKELKYFPILSIGVSYRIH